MRSLKKIIRDLYRRYQYRGTIERVMISIRQALGEDIDFAFSSFGGADIHYYLMKGQAPVAIARIALIDSEEMHPTILRFNRQERLANEYHAYSLGSKEGLTPSVLWYSDEAVVCEYLKGERLYDILQKEKGRVWYILQDVIAHYLKLHALGITHLDATLKNFIQLPNDGGLRVIDFEYYAIGTLSIEAQKAYDHLRVIEHTLRMIPESYQSQYGELITMMRTSLPDEVKSADLEMITPLIQNLKHFPIYGALKEEVFTHLEL